MFDAEEEPGVRVRWAVPYGCDQQLDVYSPGRGDQASPALLLWHGTGCDERDVLEPLARATAALGVVVFVPDWRSDATDRGQAHLLASLDYFRERAVDAGADPARLVLAGWSRGGTEAAAVALSPSAVGGWRPSAVACISGSFLEAAALTGRSPLDQAQAVAVPPPPVWLVHGIRDTTVPVEQSRHLAALLEQRGWPVHLEETDTEHAGVVMTEYDPALGRCRPATADHAIAAGRRTAEMLALAAQGDGG
jgi:acetyl esterase/lipase